MLRNNQDNHPCQILFFWCSCGERKPRWNFSATSSFAERRPWGQSPGALYAPCVAQGLRTTQKTFHRHASCAPQINIDSRPRAEIKNRKQNSLIRHQDISILDFLFSFFVSRFFFCFFFSFYHGPLPLVRCVKLLSPFPILRLCIMLCVVRFPFSAFHVSFSVFHLSFFFVLRDRKLVLSAAQLLARPVVLSPYSHIPCSPWNVVCVVSPWRRTALPENARFCSEDLLRWQEAKVIGTEDVVPEQLQLTLWINEM